MKLSIRRATMEDAPVYVKMLKDKETIKWMASVFRATDYTSFFHYFIIIKPDSIVYSVLLNKKVIGFVDLVQIDKGNKTGNLGYVIDKKYRNHGYATKAVSLFLKELFLAKGFNSIYAQVVASNVASVRVLSENGFLHSGFLREGHRHETGYEGKMIFDLLKREFKS